MTININPILFSVGPLTVRWYGLMYVVGITIGLLVAWRYAKSKGITAQQLERGRYVGNTGGFCGRQALLCLAAASWPIFNGALAHNSSLGRWHGILWSHLRG